MACLLVVDDSLVDRRVVGGLLEAAGYNDIVFATNGAEALVQMRQSPPSLVITDLNMPQLNGLELVQGIAREFSRVPVILMTGFGSEEIAVQALRAGAASYVPKRALSVLLCETVGKLLAISGREETEKRLLEFLNSNEMEFALENDLTLVPNLVSYLRNCLHEMGLVDESVAIRVSVALEEAILNAIFHGNLELGSEIRELESSEYHAIVNSRRSSLPYRERKVTVHVRLDRKGAEFVIRDQGPGFAPDKLPDPTDISNLERSSGRGVLLMRTFMDHVSFNEQGNEVTMRKLLTES